MSTTILKQLTCLTTSLLNLRRRVPKLWVGILTFPSLRWISGFSLITPNNCGRCGQYGQAIWVGPKHPCKAQQGSVSALATRFLKGKHPTTKSRLINLESISHIEYIAGMLVARESLIQEVQDSEGAICEAMERWNVRSHFSGNNGALPPGEGKTARFQFGLLY